MLKHSEKRKNILRLTEANFYYNPENPWPTVAKVANWGFMGNIQLADMFYLTHIVWDCTIFRTFFLLGCKTLGQKI